MKEKKYTIFDLFAGCGGLSQGFLDIKKFKIPIANEYWKPAQLSYKSSHPETKLFEESIIDLTNSKIDNELKNQNIKKIDVIIGGPPCQGFSMAGSRNPNDPRNRLFMEFARIVEHLEPKFFVFENVKGLLTMKDELGNSIIKQIVKKFKEIDGGYELQYKVLNSADYGVPQKRERIILIGSNMKGIEEYKFHPIPTHCPKEDLRELKKWFDRNGEYFFNLNQTQICNIKKIKTLNDLPNFSKNIISRLKNWNSIINFIGDLENKEDIEDKFNHKPMNHTKIVKKRMSLIKEGENIPNDQSSWSEELKRKKFASVYKRLDRNKPACTMVPGHSAFPIHYRLNRSLTVREAARIQTLPDKLKFFGSKTEQCLTVGNAVPTIMAKNIAKVIEKLLSQGKK